MGSGREGPSRALRRREQVGRCGAGRGGVRFGLPRTPSGALARGLQRLLDLVEEKPLLPTILAGVSVVCLPLLSSNSNVNEFLLLVFVDNQELYRPFLWFGLLGMVATLVPLMLVLLTRHLANRAEKERELVD